MKVFIGLVVLVLVVSSADGQEQTTGFNWYARWDDTPPDDFELFPSPGVIIPDLTVSDSITIAGEVWNADDLLESIGYLCRDLGPTINPLTGGIVRQVCEPVLQALRDESSRDTYRLCNETWSLIVGLFGGQDYGSYPNPDGPYPGGPYPTTPYVQYPPDFYYFQSFVNYLIGLEYWQDAWSSCNALERLYDNVYNYGPGDNNIFDKLLTIGIYSMYSEADNRCSYGQYYDQFQNDVVGSIFRILGDYGSTTELCENLYHSNFSLLTRIQENFYTAVTNHDECRRFLSEFQSDVGVAPSNYSIFETDNELCDAVITSFTNGSESAFGADKLNNGQDGNTTNAMGWLNRVIHYFGGVYRAQNDTRAAVEILCHLAESPNKDFCSTITSSSYPSFNHDCQNDFDENQPYYPAGYWDIRPLVNDLLDSSDSSDQYGVCYGLSHLYYGQYHYGYWKKRNAFDELLSVVVIDMISTAEELCYHIYHTYSDNNDTYYSSSYDVNLLQNQVMVSFFKFLGDYSDIREFCHGIDNNNTYYYNYHDDRRSISDTVKDNFYKLVYDSSTCVSFMESFGNETGLSASDFSSFGDNNAFCTAIENTFTGVDTYLVSDEDDFGGRLLNLSAAIYRQKNDTRSAAKLLCFVADGTDKKFCQNLNMTDYPSFGDECTAREEIYFNEPNEYSLGAFLRNIVYRWYHYDEASCHVLGELYHSGHTNITDIFDHLLTAFINNSAFWFFRNCHPYEYYYEHLEQIIDTSLMFFSDSTFSLTTTADICNITKRAYKSPNRADFVQFINSIKENLYNAMSSDSACEDAVWSLQTILNISFVDYSTFDNISDICHSGLVPIFQLSNSMTDPVPMAMNSSFPSLNVYDFEWFTNLLHVTATIRQMNSTDFTVKALCNMAFGTSKRFCRSIGYQNFSQDFNYECRYYYEPSDPDIIEIYRGVGEFILRTLDFNTYYYYYDSCTSLEHILKIRQDVQTVPDFLVTSVIHFLMELFVDNCYYDDSVKEQPFATTLALLAGFDNLNDFCNVSHAARYYSDNQKIFNEIVQQIKEISYIATFNESTCLDAMTSLQAAANFGDNISSSIDGPELCTALFQAFDPNHDADMSNKNPHMHFNGSEGFLSHLQFLGKLFRLRNPLNATRYLCYASDEIYHKGLCDGLERFVSDFRYECSYGCPSCYGRAVTSYPGYPYHSNYTYPGSPGHPYHSNYTYTDSPGYPHHSNYTYTDSPGYPYDSSYSDPGYAYVPYPFYSSDYWSFNPLVSSLVYQTWLSAHDTCNAFNQFIYNDHYYNSNNEDLFGRLLSVFMYESIRYANWSCSEQFSEDIPLVRIHPVIVRLLGKFEDNDEMCNYTQHAAISYNGAPFVSLADSMKANLLEVATDTSACEGFMESFTSLTSSDVFYFSSFDSIPQLCRNLTDILGPSFDAADALTKLLEYPNKIDSLTTREWFHSRALMIATLYSFGNETASVVNMLCYLSPGLDNKVCRNISLYWDSVYQYYHSDYYYYSYDFYSFCMYGFSGYSSQISPKGNDLHICYRGDFINFNALGSFNYTGFLLDLASYLYGLSSFDRDGVCTSVSDVIDSGINLRGLISDFGREWLELFLPIGAEICQCWETFLVTIFPPGRGTAIFGAQEIRNLVDFAARSLNFPTFQDFCTDLTSSLTDEQSINQYIDQIITMGFGLMEDVDQCICLANEGIRITLSLFDIPYDVFRNQYLYPYTGFRTVDELCYQLTGAFSGHEVTEEEKIQSQLNQACGVCGGDTAGCFTIQPPAIPAGSEYALVIRGRDSQPQPGSKCIVMDMMDDSISVESSITTDQCTVNLEAGSYRVYLSSPDGVQSENYADLFVYPEIQLDAIFPSEFDLPINGSFVYFSLVSSNGNFSSIKEAGFTPEPMIINEITGGSVEGAANAISYFSEYDTSSIILQTSVPPASAAFRVFLSLNGIDPLPTPDLQGLLVTFFAEDPKPLNLKFSDQGNGLLLTFDRFISIDSETSCDEIFTNTSILGTGSSCSTRPQSKVLYIRIGQGNNLVEIDDNLTLKQNSAIGVFGEDYTRPQEGATLSVQRPNATVPVRARLEGNDIINFCSFVRIGATKSTGSAGRSMEFKWSGGPDHPDLQQIYDDSGSRLSFNGSYLTPGMTYEFRVNVTNFLGASDSATFQLTREATVAPEVSIVAQRVSLDQPIKVSEPFGLTAEVAFSEQCGGTGQVSFSWFSNVPGVEFDPKFASRRSLFIPAGTLPGDMAIPITVSVSKVDDPSQVTNRTVMVTTVSSDPVAKIKGSRIRTIGVSSGNVEFDGSRSFDPDGRDDLLQYFWTCMNVFSQGPCLSEGGSDILPANQTNSTTITFDASLMVPETLYVITLEVTKNVRSATDTAYIHAKAGTPPQIIPGPVDERVRSDKYFFFAGIIDHTSEITVVWESITDAGEGYIDMTDLYGTQEYKPGRSLTAFVLSPGTLEEGLPYTFQVTATDAQNQVAVSSINTRVYAGVSSCTFSLLTGDTSYTELDTIIFVVENCVTDEDALPLNYQLFLKRSLRFRALTDAVFEDSFEQLGRAAPVDVAYNHYVAKVCNTFGSCARFSLHLTVITKPSFSLIEFQAIKDTQVEEAKSKGDFDQALNVFLAVLETFLGKNSRRKRAVTSVPTETEENAAELLSLIRSAIDSSVLTPASAQTRIDQSDAITITDLTITDIGVLLGIYEDLLEVFFNDEELLPSDSADVISGKLDDILGQLTLPEDKTLHERVRNLSLSVLNARLLGAPPGETVDTVSEFYQQRAVNDIPQGIYSTTSNDSTSFEVGFGSDIGTMFGPSWECGNIDPCSGADIILTHYNADVDFLSESPDDTRASAILDIKLYKPSSGEMLSVSGLTTPVTINLTATLLQEGKVYDCYFWDTASSSWSIEGVTTVYLSDAESQCLSSHLTAFALFGVDPPSTTAAPTATPTATAKATGDGSGSTVTNSPTTAIPGGSSSGVSLTIIIVIAVVSVLIVIVVIVVVAIVCVKSKCSENNKVRDITPPPNRPGDIAMRP